MSGFIGAPPIVTDGLVLALDSLNYESYTPGSTTWSDLSGNNFNASSINGAEIINGVAVFDGTDDYWSVTNSAELQNALKSNHTIGLFFKVDNDTDFNTRRNLIHKQYYAEVSTVIETNNRISYYWAGDTTNDSGTYCNKSTQTISSINAQEWYYICFARDIPNATLKRYTNGVLTQTKTICSPNTYSVTSNSPLLIGDGYVSNFHGEMPIVQIYNRTLSNQEVSQNYNALKGRFGL